MYVLQPVGCVAVQTSLPTLDLLTSSRPPGVGAPTQSALGVRRHGGAGRQYCCGPGGGPGHTQPAGQRVSQTVPQQPQSG